MLIINDYYLGTTIRLSGAFSDPASAPVDPSSVTVKVLAPDGSVTTFVYGVDSALIKDDVGLYHLDYLADQAGEYCHRWEGTGAATVVTQAQFNVVEGCAFP